MSGGDNVLSSTISSITSSSTTTAPTQSTLMAISKAPAIVDPLSHVGDGIFLQTKTAQGLAGICVWVALFLTCQQVSLNQNSRLLLRLRQSFRFAYGTNGSVFQGIQIKLAFIYRKNISSWQIKISFVEWRNDHKDERRNEIIKRKKQANICISATFWWFLAIALWLLFFVCHSGDDKI